MTQSRIPIKERFKVESSRKHMTQNHFIEQGFKIVSLYEERTQGRIFNLLFCIF